LSDIFVPGVGGYRRYLTIKKQTIDILIIAKSGGKGTQKPYEAGKIKILIWSGSSHLGIDTIDDGHQILTSLTNRATHQNLKKAIQPKSLIN
jgi:hypothetical protein